jgi:hypothetical protein
LLDQSYLKFDQAASAKTTYFCISSYLSDQDSQHKARTNILRGTTTTTMKQADNDKFAELNAPI